MEPEMSSTSIDLKHDIFSVRVSSSEKATVFDAIIGDGRSVGWWVLRAELPGLQLDGHQASGCANVRGGSTEVSAPTLDVRG